MAANNKGREEKNNPREQSGARENESNLRSNASSKNKDNQKDNQREDESSDTARTRKPGSQSNSSKQGNNGRGGGK
jgi:hypothetical protein